MIIKWDSTEPKKYINFFNLKNIKYYIYIYIRKKEFFFPFVNYLKDPLRYPWTQIGFAFIV